MGIAIDWDFGRPRTGAEDDEARASVAAEAVLNEAGVSYAQAEAEYRRQWEEMDDAQMTGLALLWIQARTAANAALTEGWYQPDEGACSIRSY